MHVTDWLPTLLDLAGCPNKDYGGLPLDGKSQATAILANVQNEYSIRQEPESKIFRTQFYSFENTKLKDYFAIGSFTSN